ncbi:MAG: polyphenol oxidase family protein, partial [Clostridia bacterium]|nr:polyphenol oxidase family protein [Clostridia bacterium]
TRNHITVSDLCTCCNSDLLWSHRATGGKRGGLAAFLVLNK